MTASVCAANQTRPGADPTSWASIASGARQEPMFQPQRARIRSFRFWFEADTRCDHRATAGKPRSELLINLDASGQHARYHIGIADQQMVEILRGLDALKCGSGDPDEPTAFSLQPRETRLRPRSALRAGRGVGIAYLADKPPEIDTLPPLQFATAIFR